MDSIALRDEDMDAIRARTAAITFVQNEYESCCAEARRYETILHFLQEDLTLWLAQCYGTSLSERWHLDVDNRVIVRVEEEGR